MSTISLARIAVLCTVVFIVEAVTVHAQVGTPPVKSSDSFVESIGMDTHFDYVTTPYYLAFQQEHDSLVALGVRHIRDGSEFPSREYLSKLDEFCTHGIKHVIGFPINVTHDRIVTAIEKYGPACIDHVEPANEYDLIAGYGAKIPDWPARVIAEQKLLYTTVRSDSRFANIVVAGPALANAALFASLGNIEQYVDVGNNHISTCDKNPQPESAHHMGFDQTRIAFPTKPVWTSETQYTDNPGTRCYLPDDIIAKYATRTSAVRFNLGQPSTNWYEFSDQPTDPRFGHEGFVDEHGLPKAQYYAMQSLIRELQDPGVAFTPHALDVRLVGDTSDLQETVLQKRNGRYEMLLWLEVPDWNTKEQAPKPVVPQRTISVQLNATPTGATYATYGSDWRYRHANVQAHDSTLQVSVGDAISVLSFDVPKR